jgi:quercetin dioxygenase-like cupin family protein
MKRLLLYIVLVLVGLIFIGVTEASAQKKMNKEPVMWAAENIKWEKMKGAPPGVMTAMLWGDQTKGAYGALTKFPPNHKNPLHTHSSDLKVIVLSGTFVGGPEGGPEKTYGPGSYMLVPGGWKHTSGAGAGGCTLFQEQSGKFDMMPVEPPKKKK